MWNPIKAWLRRGDERAQARWDRIARSYIEKQYRLDKRDEEARDADEASL